MSNFATERTIILHTQEIVKDKQKFVAASAEINGKWYKIKFTQNCEGIPKKKGLYELTFNVDNCSVEHGKLYTTKDGETKTANDVIWVKEIVKLREFTKEELEELNRLVFKEVFGS